MEWFKLKSNLLQNDKIALIRAEVDGDALAFLWVGLLCLAGSEDNGGVFRIGDVALTVRMLAHILNTSPDRMRRALELFKKYGMVAEKEGALYLPGWEKHQAGAATAAVRRQKERDRKRLYRESLKSDEAACDCPQSVPDLSQECPHAEEEKEKEKEKETPPIVPPGDGRASFASFWKVYPKKEGRSAAEKAWLRLAPDEETVERIHTYLAARSRTEEWLKENGRFVPRADNFLHRRCWEDPLPEETSLPRSYDLAEAFERAVARQRSGLMTVAAHQKEPPEAALEGD